MEKYVIKFGNKYVEDYETGGGEILRIGLTNDLFNAIEVKRRPADELKKFIDSGAEVTELTIYESNKNFEIKREIEESEK